MDMSSLVTELPSVTFLDDLVVSKKREGRKIEGPAAASIAQDEGEEEGEEELAGKAGAWEDCGAEEAAAQRDDEREHSPERNDDADDDVGIVREFVAAARAELTL